MRQDRFGLLQHAIPRNSKAQSPRLAAPLTLAPQDKSQKFSSSLLFFFSSSTNTDLCPAIPSTDLSVFRLITGQLDVIRSHHLSCGWFIGNPVDRSQIKCQLQVFTLVLSSLLVNSAGEPGCWWRHIPDPFAEAVGW